MNNAEKLVAGLKSRGLKVSGLTWFISRNFGQGMMNKAAGEAAPTWELRCDALYYHTRRVDGGSTPDVEYDGKAVSNCEIGSHIPLVWLLKHRPETWEIYWYPDCPTQLRVDAPKLPPNW